MLYQRRGTLHMRLAASATIGVGRKREADCVTADGGSHMWPSDDIISSRQLIQATGTSLFT